MDSRCFLPLLVIQILSTALSPCDAAGETESMKDCSEHRTIPLSTIPASKQLEKGPTIGTTDVGNRLFEIYRILGAPMSQNVIPDAVRDADALDSRLVTKLLLGGAGGFWLVVPCLVLAAIVPVLGLRVLWRRYKEPPVYQPETQEQGATRRRTSLMFWIPVVLLCTMAIGALLTRHHASEALESATKQAQYLADNIPAVLYKPINDINLVVGPNFDNFSAALNERLKECYKEAGNAVDGLNKDPLLTFSSTASERLLAIKDLADEIEQEAHSDDLSTIRASFEKASNALRAGVVACGKDCTDTTNQTIANIIDTLAKLVQSTQIELPQGLVHLRDEIEKGDSIATLKQVRSTKNLKRDLENKTKEIQKRLKAFRDRFNKSIGQLNESAKRVVKKVQNVSVSLANLPDEVKANLDLYETAVTCIAFMVAIIVGIYMFGNQCIMRRAQTGFCSFHTASWAMTVAACMFLVVFPMLMVASSFGATTGLAIDRRLCSPAMDLGAPTSRPFVKFLAAKLGTEASRGPTDVLHEGEAKATSGSGNRRREHLTIASVKRRPHHSKHAYVRRSARESALRRKTLNRGKLGELAKGRRRQRRRGHDSGLNLRDFQLAADTTSALAKELTPEALEGVIERFAQCSQSGLPFFQIFGKDLVTRMARSILGPKSPWLGLVDDSAGGPKIEALEKLGTEAPELNKKIKDALKAGEYAIDVDDIAFIAEAARNAKNDIRKVKTTTSAVARKNSVGQASIVLGPAFRAVDEAMKHKKAFESRMDGIFTAADNLTKMVMVDGKALDEYVKEYVGNWESMKTVFDGTARTLLMVGNKTKTGFKNDLLQLYNHTKDQMRLHVGDCRPFHVLYVSTVETVCAHGVATFVSALSTSYDSLRCVVG